MARRYTQNLRKVCNWWWEKSDFFLLLRAIFSPIQRYRLKTRHRCAYELRSPLCQPPPHPRIISLPWRVKILQRQSAIRPLNHQQRLLHRHSNKRFTPSQLFHVLRQRITSQVARSRPKPITWRGIEAGKGRKVRQIWGIYLRVCGGRVARLSHWLWQWVCLFGYFVVGVGVWSFC